MGICENICLVKVMMLPITFLWCRVLIIGRVGSGNDDKTQIVAKNRTSRCI